MGWDGRMPDVKEYLSRIAFCFLLFGVIDYFYARHTKGRYFAIHIVANSIVVISTLPSMVFMVTDPAGALISNDYSVLAMCSNLCIHIYHMTMFSNLHWIDWLHHGLMTGIVTPIVIAYGNFIGPLTDGQQFFTCGLPGGIDYILLFAMKHGWIKPLTEKTWNRALNVWVRGPGIMLMCALGYVQAFVKDPTVSWLEWPVIPEVTLLLLLLWNAQFFTARVVANHAVRSYEFELAAKEKCLQEK